MILYKGYIYIYNLLWDIKWWYYKMVVLYNINGGIITIY